MQASRSKNKKNKNKNKPSAQAQTQAHSHIHSAHCNEHHHQGDLQPPSEPSDQEYDEKGYERHKGIMDDPEEFDHFKNVVSAFFNYKHDSMRDVERMEENFSFIGPQYQKYMKTNYTERIKKMEECIEKNFTFLCHMVHEQQFLFQFKTTENGGLEIPKLNVSHKDIQKMRSTIRQFVRDWSSQGKKEREECYGPIIEEFKKYYPEPFVDGKRVRVLFPGCGLARLVLDFAAMDYGAQGNEFSYFMLLAANFILNVVDQPEKYEIHPFIHSWCNLFSDADAFETYKIPDVCPGDMIKPGADFSMVAGEFIEVYRDQKEHWESVITCFFIDTANNIIQYIETIYDILKEGGVWINFGPLLYHYADMESEKSIELSWEEVRHVILQMGFEIKSESVKESTYAMERKTMMEVRYNCVFFTAVKPKKTK